MKPTTAAGLHHRIETLIEMALEANANRQWARLSAAIRELDEIWDDDHAALAFYTRLEQEAAR